MRGLFGRWSLLGMTILPMAGCAWMVTSSSQWIAIETNPRGAECWLERAGFAVEHVARTPASV